MVTYARRTGANALHNLSNIFRSTVHSTLHRDSAVRSLSILEERRQTGAQLPKGKFLLWEGMFLYKEFFHTKCIASLARTFNLRKPTPLDKFLIGQRF